MADIHTPVGDAPLIPVIMLVAGGYLAWFGIHYFKDTKTVWPSTPVKDVLTGKGIPAPVPETTTADLDTQIKNLASSGGGASIGVQTGGLPSAGTYTHAELVSLWQQAGGSAGSANNAACHGIQESGGDAMAISDNPDGGKNVGIWQLDTKGVGAGYTVEELQNAMNNARITVFATQNGSNWSQWSTPGC
jgi:hypothetical protein